MLKTAHPLSQRHVLGHRLAIVYPVCLIPFCFPCFFDVQLNMPGCGPLLPSLLSILGDL
jgi:hypothetical protein